MARKKSEAGTGDVGSATGAAGKPAAKAAAKAPRANPAAAKSSKKPAPTAAAPMIDTSLAANNAAAMVASKAGQTPASDLPRKESGAFKQLKAGLNKPAAAPLGGAFGVPQSSKKSPLPFGGGNQIGRNQNVGADVKRTGVPRRTPG